MKRKVRETFEGKLRSCAHKGAAMFDEDVMYRHFDSPKWKVGDRVRVTVEQIIKRTDRVIERLPRKRASK